MTKAYALAAMLGLSCVTVSLAHAHPIHTTLTTVTLMRGEITLSVRTFADDFSASVAALAGKQTPEDWSVTEADVARYLDAHLRIANASGKALTLRSCGIRRERELYWLCVRVEGATELRGLRAENRLLTERHADQVNIVQVNNAKARKTMLFTKQTTSLALSD